MPRYRENPLIVKFSMLCPGISQNTKHHQLTLYKGQVWREKSYLELCNHNVLNILYDWTANHDGDRWPIEQNGELYVPPVPGFGFIDDYTLIPWDSEMLQSFAKLTHITNMTFHYYDTYEDSQEDVTYQIKVGTFVCSVYHYEQCVPPSRYLPWYIWTKEGLKIQIRNIRFHYLHFFRILTPLPPVSSTRIPDSQFVWIVRQFMLGHGYLHMADSMVYIQTARVHSR